MRLEEWISIIGEEAEPGLARHELDLGGQALGVLWLSQPADPADDPIAPDPADPDPDPDPASPARADPAPGEPAGPSGPAPAVVRVEADSGPAAAGGEAQIGSWGGVGISLRPAAWSAVVELQAHAGPRFAPPPAAMVLRASGDRESLTLGPNPLSCTLLPGDHLLLPISQAHAARARDLATALRRLSPAERRAALAELQAGAGPESERVADAQEATPSAAVAPGPVVPPPVDADTRPDTPGPRPFEISEESELDPRRWGAALVLAGLLGVLVAVVVTRAPEPAPAPPAPPVPEVVVAAPSPAPKAPELDLGLPLSTVVGTSPRTKLDQGLDQLLSALQAQDNAFSDLWQSHFLVPAGCAIPVGAATLHQVFGKDFYRWMGYTDRCGQPQRAAMRPPVVGLLKLVAWYVAHEHPEGVVRHFSLAPTDDEQQNQQLRARRSTPTQLALYKQHWSPLLVAIEKADMTRLLGLAMCVPELAETPHIQPFDYLLTRRMLHLSSEPCSSFRAWDVERESARRLKKLASWIGTPESLEPPPVPSRAEILGSMEMGMEGAPPPGPGGGPPGTPPGGQLLGPPGAPGSGSPGAGPQDGARGSPQSGSSSGAPPASHSRPRSGR